MPEAERTVMIERPPDEVFAFFTDHANDPAWRPNLVRIDGVADAAPGTRIQQIIKGPMGRGLAADIQVTVNERPSRYVFEVVAGPVRPRGEFRFAPAGAGTEVRFALTAEVSGIKGLLLSRAVQSSMDGEMAGLDTAKRLIEGS
jgi:uncharacterized membrane protein